MEKFNSKVSCSGLAITKDLLAIALSFPKFLHSVLGTAAGSIPEPVLFLLHKTQNTLGVPTVYQLKKETLEFNFLLRDTLILPSPLFPSLAASFASHPLD